MCDEFISQADLILAPADAVIFPLQTWWLRMPKEEAASFCRLDIPTRRDMAEHGNNRLAFTMARVPVTSE